MNLVLLFPEDFIAPATVRLQGRRQKHIQNILRPSVGDRLCVGILNGKMGTGRVRVSDHKGVELDVVLTEDPPQPPPVILILCLPRPIVLKRLLSSVTSLGIKKLILLSSARVEKSFWNSPVLEEKNMRQQFILGLEQAKDTVMPEVLLCPHFRSFCKDKLSDFVQGRMALLAHPQAHQQAPRGVRGPMTLIIGPEGGFVPHEIEMLENGGCRAIFWEKRILRVETAVLTLLGRLL